jgi:hypothetical protein
MCENILLVVVQWALSFLISMLSHMDFLYLLVLNMDNLTIWNFCSISNSMIDPYFHWINKLGMLGMSNDEDK